MGVESCEGSISGGMNSYLRVLLISLHVHIWCFATLAIDLLTTELRTLQTKAVVTNDRACLVQLSRQTIKKNRVNCTEKNMFEYGTRTGTVHLGVLEASVSNGIQSDPVSSAGSLSLRIPNCALLEELPPAPKL
jgi:hypothetical protein